MSQPIFEKLHSEGLLSEESLNKIKALNDRNILSVHWELRTILYLGVLLLTSGLGVLVYKNIDSIGHLAILMFIAALCIGSFFYCFKNKLPFSTIIVNPQNSFFDYVLLLACLCFIIFISYWQYQYHVFADRFGVATFIPMAVLFFCAYFFDHLGILSLAITNLAAWVGIVVTPTQILKANDFNSSAIIITGLLLGIVLVAAGKLTAMRIFKPHFSFTYTNFGMNILFISCLTGLFRFDAVFILWFFALVGIAVYFYFEAVKSKSFYFLLMLTLYTYVGLSYTIIHSIFLKTNSELSFYLIFIYFISSAIGLIMFLIKMNNKLKAP